jgi:hypothetical protein
MTYDYNNHYQNYQQYSFNIEIPPDPTLYPEIRVKARVFTNIIQYLSSTIMMGTTLIIMPSRIASFASQAT